MQHSGEASEACISSDSQTQELYRGPCLQEVCDISFCGICVLQSRGKNDATCAKSCIKFLVAMSLERERNYVRVIRLEFETTEKYGL